MYSVAENGGPQRVEVRVQNSVTLETNVTVVLQISNGDAVGKCHLR